MTQTRQGSLGALDKDLAPDPTFGTGGIVTYDGSANANDKGFAVTIQNDSKIVVAGDRKFEPPFARPRSA